MVELFERERAVDRLDTPERRASLKVCLERLAAMIGPPDLRAIYRQGILNRFYALSGSTAQRAGQERGLRLSRDGPLRRCKLRSKLIAAGPPATASARCRPATLRLCCV